jgi:hypothetical protein
MALRDETSAEDQALLGSLAKRRIHEYGLNSRRHLSPRAIVTHADVSNLVKGRSAMGFPGFFQESPRHWTRCGQRGIGNLARRTGRENQGRYRKAKKEGRIFDHHLVEHLG